MVDPMEVGRKTATFLIVVTVGGGATEEITARALEDAGRDRTMIASEAGPLSGTILHDQEKGGYLALDARQRVELVVRRYRGGSISDYFV
jgi:hypothetical protein